MSKHFVLSLLTIFVFVLLTLATVSGRWLKTDDMDIWGETGIWSICPSCRDLQTNNCQLNNTFLRVVQGFSIIAALAEFFAVIILAHEAVACRGNKTHWTSAMGLFALAIIANIITWTTYAGYFRKEDMCATGDLSLKQQGYRLSWGFGIRLIELGALVVVLALCFMLSGRGAERTTLHSIAFLLIALLMMATLLTTSGRGWSWKRDIAPGHVNGEFGLWDQCGCIEWYDSTCDDIRQRIRTVEVFSVVSIVMTGLLLVIMNKANEWINVQRIFSALAIVANVIVLVTFTESYKGTYCGGSLNAAQHPHWAYGAICAALILQTLVFFSLLLCCSAAEAEEKKVHEGSEPTA